MASKMQIHQIKPRKKTEMAFFQTMVSKSTPQVVIKVLKKLYVLMQNCRGFSHIQDITINDVTSSCLLYNVYSKRMVQFNAALTKLPHPENDAL
jgi:hypothetical protein